MWLNQPSDYSGDTWHIAAAMVVNSAVGVCQTVSQPIPDAESQARRAQRFYGSIGFDDRVRCFRTPENLRDGLQLRLAPDRVEYNERNMALARTQLAQANERGQLLYVYQATALVMNALPVLGRNGLIGRLSHGLCQGFDHRSLGAAAIGELVETIPKSAIVVVGRYGGYHRRYNADLPLLREIREVALATNRQAILIADRDTEAAQSAQHELGIVIIDPYHVHSNLTTLADPRYVDMRSVAYFWRVLASARPTVTVVGGRSGATDIAAFMGARVMQWDHCDPEDPESLRLRSMCNGLCSTLEFKGHERLRSVDEYAIHNNDGSVERCSMSAREAIVGVATGRFQNVCAKCESALGPYVVVS